MTSEEADVTPISTTMEPRFLNDLVNVFLSLTGTIVIWIVFFYFYPFFISLGIIGLIIIFVLIMLLLPYTILQVSRFLEVIAYQLAAYRTGVPYMNYKTKCPFFKRRLLTFSCRAEQLAPFNASIFEKCHKEPKWIACWPERIPSIIETYDNVVPKQKQNLAFIVAAMKEHGTPAAMKMHEGLIDETNELDARISAGYALAEMKQESGIIPLISMVGLYDQRRDQTIRAVVARFGELSIPYLISALQDCDTDNKCGGLIEIMGKIRDENTIPALKSILEKETSGEYTRLQTLYALQEIDSDDSYKVLIAHLEFAPEEERDIIKEACLSRKLITFPLLIDLLTNPEISEEYYSYIGDILIEVDTNTYDRFFTKLMETKGAIEAQRLAKLLKKHTPEEEEFHDLQKILTKYSEPIVNSE